MELLLRWSGRRGFDRRCCRSCFVGGNGGGAVRLAWMWDYTAGLGVILYAVAGLRFKNTKESEIGAEYGQKGIKVSRLSLDVGLQRMYRAPPSHEARCPVIMSSDKGSFDEEPSIDTSDMTTTIIKSCLTRQTLVHTFYFYFLRAVVTTELL